MAEARSRLEYLAGGTIWTRADTDQGSSGGTLGTGTTAVVKLRILDKLYSPSLAFVTLFNKSPNPLSSVVDGTPNNTDTQGRLTGVFTSFMQCRIIEEETGLCIFRGRVYQVYDRVDDGYGSVIELELKDALAELQDFPLDITPTTLHKLDIAQTANNTRSKLIQKIITQLEFSGNIGTTDVNKFETSAKIFGASTDVHPTFDLSDSKQTALKVISELAFGDPHYTSDTDEAKSIGYDYYLDPNITSNSSTHVSVPALNYFPRSARPGPGSTDVKDPSLNSLTFELPADNWDGETAFKRAMAQDAEFERDRNNIYTSVIVTFEDANETEVGEDTGNLDTDSAKKLKVLEFEKLSGTISGTNAQFTWAGRNLNKDGTLPPDQLFKADGTVVATVQYQSGTGANEYLILSDINSDFPTSGSQTLYKDHNNQGGLASIAFNAVTDRPVKAFGIRKPTRLRLKILPQYDKIRTTISNYLVKSTNETVRGQFSILKYPYFYIEAVAANAQRGSSGDGYRIVFTNSAFLNSAGASGTNNPRDYGVQEGMVIAQVDETNPLALTRYAYISEVGADFIKFGQSINGTDTSDGIAIDTAKSVRLYIPLRAGDMMFTRHRISDIVSNQLILEIEHVEEIGISLTSIKSVGENVIGVNRLAADAGGPAKSTLSDRIGTNTDIGMINPIERNSQAWRFTGTFISLDNNTIQYSAGTLESDDGTFISITGANSPDLGIGDTYDIYYDTGTGFTFTLRAEYNPKPSDIWMGWCKGQSTGGKAIVSLIGQRLYAGVDASLALDEGSLGAALQSKGARPYLTDLKLFPGMVSRVAAVEVNNSSDPIDVQVTDAADAQKFHVSAVGGSNDAYIKIDDEILKVGSVSDGDAYLENCVRAQQGTAIATHAIGANVFQVQQFHVSGSGNGIISAYKELTGTSKVASNHRVAASVYFADRPADQAFSISPLTASHSYNGSAVVGTSGTLFGNTTKTISYFLYCDIPASDTAASLKATIDQTVAFGDDKLFLGLMTTTTRTQSSKVNVAAASFSYSKTKEGTISASLISANAIIADHISANSITADAIKAGSIVTNHISGRLDGSVITVDGNVSFSSGYNSGTANTNATQALADAATAASAASSAASAASAAQGTANTANTLAGTKRTIHSALLGSPPTSLAQYDFWLTTDTQQLYIAMHATANNEITSGEWTLREDATAINNATTSINGGLITTQRIKLLKGGGSSGTIAPNVMDIAPTSTLRLINDSGGISASDTTIGIDSFDTNDLRIYAGDIIRIAKTAGGTEDMYVKGGSDTSLTVIRAWNSTTAGACADNTLIYKYTKGLAGQNAAAVEASHITGLTNPHIIMDNYGIVGYSSAWSPEFSLSSETGKGVFGGGQVEVGTIGMTFKEGGGEVGFMKWEAPSVDDAYIYRKQADNGWPTGTMIFSVPQGISFWGYVDVDEIHFQSKNHGYTEFATLEAPYNYDASGSSNTARYVMTLPTAGPTAASQSLQTSGSSPYSQLVWGTSSDANGWTGGSYNSGTGVVTFTSDDGLGFYTGNLKGADGADGNDGNDGDDGDDGSDGVIQYSAGTNIQINGTTINSSHSHSYGDITAALAGSGMTGGSYSGNATLTLGTPGTLTSSTSNTVTSSSHTHAVTGLGTTITGNGPSSGNRFAVWTNASTLSQATTGTTADLWCDSFYCYDESPYFAEISAVDYTNDLQISTNGLLTMEGSSLRFKENIVTLVVDTSKIYNLTPKTFKWKNHTEKERDSDGAFTGETITVIGKTQFGYIAEEVHEILPEIVTYNESDEPHGVLYKMLSVLLLEELKKLKARVDVLEGG